MKELSIEEKAKRYDKAIERARTEYKNHEAFKGFCEMLVNIFPELKDKESEDERIRKELIKLLRNLFNNYSYFIKDPFYTECINWLEKQDCKDIHLLELKAKAYDDAKERMSYAYNQNRVPIGFINEIFPNIKLYEKQGEQKSVDKVEPKFKVGDWVVTDLFNIVQIKAIDNDKYVLEDTMRFSISVDYADNCWHRWTIQDAKDGDVLAVDWYQGDDSWEKIIIFKKYHNKGIEGLINTPCVEGYGNTFKNRKMAFVEEVPYYSKTWTDNLHPATTEQRNLLFQRMKEAGE